MSYEKQGTAYDPDARGYELQGRKKMTQKIYPVHSPLGASSAERWMQCPASVRLGYGVPDEESEYAAEGTLAHDVAARCLRHGWDAWSQMATNGVNKEMADAVQVYLDDIRYRYKFELDDLENGDYAFIEHQFHCPSIHEFFYGQADFGYIDKEKRTLDIHDYKHGAGIVVDVINNPQIMYYACGILEEFNLWIEIDKVNLHIAQPRGFHFDGPLRQWSISTEELGVWLEETLVPAMETALESEWTASGEHCRFCPARKLACPQLECDMDEMEEFMLNLNLTIQGKDAANQLSDAQVGRFLELFDVAKIVQKAALTTAFARMTNGGDIPGRKLVKKRSNRDWKEGATEALVNQFGVHAHTMPVLKSPANIDKMPGGTELTARYAHKPDAGLSVANDGDPRLAVTSYVKRLAVTSYVKDLFKDVTK